MPLGPPASCWLCGGGKYDLAHTFDSRPEGETDFGIADYLRELWRCDTCGHIVNRHNFDLDRLYEGRYMETTYAENLEATFDRIMALPEDKSDNRQRVRRIDAYLNEAGLTNPGQVLDIGAGLGVFPAAMVERGWSCVAIDPDPRGVEHIQARTGSEALCGDFMSLKPSGMFDLLSFNKVLEHVLEMQAMLARAKDWLGPEGTVYLELPDAEGALADSPAREEFFIEHHCAFSMASIALLAQRAGFQADIIRRLREPSGKYTLAAFLSAP